MCSVITPLFLDLVTIKANIGDQSYALPAPFDPQKYEGVSIWCKRFGGDFAGTSLGGAAMAGAAVASDPAPQVASAPVQAAPDSNSKTVAVTTGKFRKVGEGVTGRATITENGSGARTLTLSEFQSAKGPNLHVYLVKAEDVKDSADVKKLDSLTWARSNR